MGIDTQGELDVSKALIGGRRGSLKGLSCNEEKLKGYGATENKSTEDYADTPIDPALLQTGKEGLSMAEAKERLNRFGRNELPEKVENKLVKFLLEFVQPMPLIIWAAIFIELAEYTVEAKGPALMDAVVLLVLQFLNVVVGFIEELKAGEEVAALKSSLKPEAVVIREGKTLTVDASTLVPGDRVCLNAGGAVPADCQVCEGQKPIQVDQAAMTGESLPVTMSAGCCAKMGSTVTRGESEALVVATGANTFFGKTAALINHVDDQPHFEIVLRELLVMLVTLGVFVCFVIFVYLRSEGCSIFEVLSFAVVLLIASIPVALRVVCTCTLALGCKELAAEKAIVARLSSVEEFAGMDILCSDKTGTLTLNKMVLQDDLPLFDDKSRDDVLKLSALAAKWWEPPKDALDTLVLNAVDCNKLTDDGYEQIDYTPFDPSLKRTEAVVRTPDGKTVKVMKGAPDVVLKLSEGNYDQIQKQVEEKVLNLATRGIRSLGVASAENDGDYRFHGILTFLDPPRADTKTTVDTARELGVDVKMITGDHRAIAIETSRTLGLGVNVDGAEALPTLSLEEMSNYKMERLSETLGERFERTDGWAQVLPEHKYLIVDVLRRKGHLTGMTGDGVNDAPALKRADVGIAVCGATSAAQAAADIVLTRPGLSTIVTALFTSRKIFQRMKNFVIYRVACTEQLLFFFFFSTLFFNPAAVNPMWETHFFKIPVIALVSITILNDGTIVSVAYDNVQPSKSPEKWNMFALYIVSTAIGMTALLGSLLLLYFALHCNEPASTWQSSFQLPALSYAQVQTVLYLKISLSDYASVFNSRCQGWMWSRSPSPAVLLAASFAMILATLLSVHLPPGMEAIEWKVVGFIWVYVLIWALIQDAVKIATYVLLKHCGFVEETEVIDEQDIEEFKKLADKAQQDGSSADGGEGEKKQEEV
eukprot:TRINITY_DN10016_c0_g2_i1.p1 TRINITY_DN10016_c0_g2~~TRINITY_DN10016_c0_g2_i1.p1  ORF type:complete len:933 (+),score=318.10 TRINITY_DN10016_c0_g2_i1:153-2951(+)